MASDTVYTIGWNMAGYLPEMDPYECETAESAADAIRDELLREIDRLHDTGYPSMAREMIAAVEDLADADVDKGWQYSAGGLVYWINATDPIRAIVEACQNHGLSASAYNSGGGTMVCEIPLDMTTRDQTRYIWITRDEDCWLIGFYSQHVESDEGAILNVDGNTAECAATVRRMLEVIWHER